MFSLSFIAFSSVSSIFNFGFGRRYPNVLVNITVHNCWSPHLKLRLIRLAQITINIMATCTENKTKSALHALNIFKFFIGNPTVITIGVIQPLYEMFFFTSSDSCLNNFFNSVQVFSNFLQLFGIKSLFNNIPRVILKSKNYLIIAFYRLLYRIHFVGPIRVKTPIKGFHIICFSYFISRFKNSFLWLILQNVSY